MDREPARREDQLGRHRRHASPRPRAEQRQLDAGEDVDRRRAARREDRRAGARHVRRVRIVADHLEREIRLDAGARCRTRRRGYSAQPSCSAPGCGADSAPILRLERRRRPARRDNGAAGYIRPGWSRRPRARTPSGRRRAAPRRALRRRARSARPGCRRGLRVAERRDRASRRLYRVNARIAKPRRRRRPSASRPRSSRAGRSASSRPPGTGCASACAAGGRSASCAGVAAKVARFSLTTCHARQRRGQAAARRRPPPRTAARQFLAVGSTSGVGGADRHRDAVGKGEDPFRRAAEHAQDRRRARPAARARSAALTIALNAVGTVSSGHQRRRDRRRHREDHRVVRRRPAPSPRRSPAPRRAVAGAADRAQPPRQRRLVRHARASHASAGSTNAAASVGCAISGRHAPAAARERCRGSPRAASAADRARRRAC